MDNLDDLGPAPPHTHSPRPASPASGLAVRDAHASFARLTQLARRALQAPEALVMLLDTAGEPAAGSGTLRDASLTYGLCHCVVESGEPLVLVETRVQGAPDSAVVAFAGVPLRDASGSTVGTMCVLDHRPRRWSDDDLRFLRELGRAAETELELRAIAAGGVRGATEARTARERAETAGDQAESPRERAEAAGDLTESAGGQAKSAGDQGESRREAGQRPRAPY